MVQMITLILNYLMYPAALLRRFHEAKINKQKSVLVWGTGNPRREFLHVSDFGKGYCLYVRILFFK